jgi:RNA polymerase sigma-B factor
VQSGQDDDYRPLGATLGELDPSLDTVIDVATVRPHIAALPDRQRAVLMLRFLENMTQSQIAERIGCSQMHVSRLLAQALSTLRSRLREPELAVTA